MSRWGEVLGFPQEFFLRRRRRGKSGSFNKTSPSQQPCSVTVVHLDHRSPDQYHRLLEPIQGSAGLFCDIGHPLLGERGTDNVAGQIPYGPRQPSPCRGWHDLESDGRTTDSTGHSTRSRLTCDKPLNGLPYIYGPQRLDGLAFRKSGRVES